MVLPLPSWSVLPLKNSVFLLTAAMRFDEGDKTQE
jgi:hypothetical protein